MGFLSGVREVPVIFSLSFLQLNSDKNEVHFIGPSKLISELNLSVGPVAADLNPSSRNFDHNLHFDSHINKLVQSCFFHLRNISKFKAMLSTRHLELLMHTLILSRLPFIPRSPLKSKGDCAFAARTSSLWNSLPSSVRSAESLLKTHLYRLAFPAIEP